MKWLAIGALLFGFPTNVEKETYPPNSILLFVASWCAPCHAELARLPAISRGAQPFRVFVVSFDETPATRAMIEGVPSSQRWHPSAQQRRLFAKELMGQTAGLPFSVGIDAKGKTCGVIRKGLDAQTAAALVANCMR